MERYKQKRKHQNKRRLPHLRVPAAPKVTRLDDRVIRLELDDQSAPTTWPSVSLCMIVKNEEENLANCLASVGDFATEIVIVDTGSADRTVEIALNWGARVEHFEWIDDFSAARNESLKYATGDWIFWMDADDRLDPHELTRLKNALVSGLADTYTCTVASDIGQNSGVAAKVTHLRLFPNHLGLHFVNPLHEDVTPVAASLGLTQAQTNITIRHTGYTADTATMQARGARNEKIIRQAMAREPHNYRLRYDLATALNLQGDYSGVIQQLETLLGQPSVPKQLGRDVYLYHAYALLIAAYSKVDNLTKALAVIERAKLEFPNRRHLWGTAGIIQWQAGNFQAAVSAFERAITLPVTADPHGYSYLPGQLERLASRPYWLLGQEAQARHVYQTMLALRGIKPGSLPHDVWRKAKKLFETKEYDQLLSWLTPLAPGDPVALRLLYRAAVDRQDWPAALFYLLDAVILSKLEGDDLIELAQVALQAQQTAVMVQICERALARNLAPSYKMVYLNLLGMNAYRQHQPEQAVEYFCLAALANPGNEAALNNLATLAQALNHRAEQLLHFQAERWLAQNCFEQARALRELATPTLPDTSSSVKVT